MADGIESKKPLIVDYLAGDGSGVLMVDEGGVGRMVCVCVDGCGLEVDCR